MLYISQEFIMKIVSEIENVFLELLFFEHGYLVYYSKSIHKIFNSHSKHSKGVSQNFYLSLVCICIAKIQK